MESSARTDRGRPHAVPGRHAPRARGVVLRSARQVRSDRRIHPITGCSWDELAMTWDTRPAIDGPVLSSVGAVALNQVVDFDVTGAIPGDGTYCFAIDNPSS